MASSSAPGNLSTISFFIKYKGRFQYTYHAAGGISLKPSASFPEYQGSASLQARSARRASSFFDYDVANQRKLSEFCKEMSAMCT